ncbi:PREDICTED: uncharacterized protein LOC108492890 [Lepidothrix coronata]|uniref:Uncharacterized protein LOC108492890 n=1 Tax=Lepidothrix coronata TaxID=321398 RepID=A0A6J0GH63_9PASS|nr:PREDICTED: uncharacterized protein LOC108492890 [Lepidothrix coronata]
MQYYFCPCRSPCRLHKCIVSIRESLAFPSRITAGSAGDVWAVTENLSLRKGVFCPQFLAITVALSKELLSRASWNAFMDQREWDVIPVPAVTQPRRPVSQRRLPARSEAGWILDSKILDSWPLVQEERGWTSSGVRRRTCHAQWERIFAFSQQFLWILDSTQEPHLPCFPARHPLHIILGVHKVSCTHPTPYSQGDLFGLVSPLDQMNSLQELYSLQKPPPAAQEFIPQPGAHAARFDILLQPGKPEPASKCRILWLIFREDSYFERAKMCCPHQKSCNKQIAKLFISGDSCCGKKRRCLSRPGPRGKRLDFSWWQEQDLSHMGAKNICIPQTVSLCLQVAPRKSQANCNHGMVWVGRPSKLGRLEQGPFQPKPVCDSMIF